MEKTVKAIARFFFAVMIGLVLVIIKEKLCLHKHFYSGIIVSSLIWILYILAEKGADKIG